MSASVILNDAFKKYTEDQDKILTPRETVDNFKARLAKLDLDILEGVKRIDNGRLDIPVFFSTCGRDARQIIGTRKQMGKGATPAQAEASAVMELAERFSFFSFLRNPANFTMATGAEMGAKALPFELIARSVHDESPALDAARQVFNSIPMRWTQGFNLGTKESLWIPFDWFYAINEFNGPSAGNCVEEALSQGICEVVERHVSSLVSRNRIAVPLLDPSRARDAKVQEMVAKYHRAGIRLYVSDFTLDTGIPTVGVMAYDPATFPEKSEIVWTAGTTPGPEKALSRALTEVAQLAGDFNSNANYVASGLPKFQALDEAAYITDSGSHTALPDLPDLSHDNMRVEVENLIGALTDHGYDVFTIDTRHPQLDIPAFYTIIPGTHFRERALNTSVGMFSAKLVAENQPPALALAKLAEIDKILPDTYYTAFYQGTCCLALDDMQTACSHFQRALERDPGEEDLPTIYSYLGVALKDMTRYDEALEVLARGEALDAERTDILNLQGFCHFKLGEHAQAVERFKKILELDPGSAIDYANIAVNYGKMGEVDLAVEFYSKALAIDPAIDWALENLKKLQKE